MSKIWKKLLAVALTASISAGAAVAGTVAYLQDDDSDVNVMTLGSVKIAQHEYQRKVDADGKFVTDTIDNQTSYVLEGFDQLKPLYPATEVDAYGQPYNYGAGDYDSTLVKMAQVKSHGSMEVFVSPNAQDKFVTVENTGKSDAYVRTLIAFEKGSLTDEAFHKVIHRNTFMTDQKVWEEIKIGTVEIDNNNYYVFEYLYNGAKALGGVHENGVLPAGETTYPSLAQVYMTGTATNEDVEAIDGNKNGTYDILVFSQAVQAEGFADAATALDTAFGDITTDNHPWADGADLPVVADTADELKVALGTAENGDIIILGDDITADVTYVVKADTKVTIDGNGNEFAGVITVDGKSATEMTAGLTIQNVNFKADSISADACIRLGDGNNATRYTCNVTVKNCTFDVPGAVGVKSYTGGDKNLTIENCTATANAHSLVQAKGIDGVLVKNCKVYSKNGLNFNNSDNVVVDGCTVDVKGYAVRFGESSGGVGAAETYTIKNSSLKSANDGGDATIVLRGTADNSTLTIVNTTIVGTPDIVNTATGATVVK